MATDGVKIIDGDTAHDTYWGIMDLFDSQIEVSKIVNEFPIEPRKYNDDFENEIYITSAGLAYWEIGIMNNKCLQIIKETIEKGECVKVWSEEANEKEGKARERVLNRFWKKINKENTKPRKPKKYRKVVNFHFDEDEVLIHKLKNGNYCALICCEINQHRGNCHYMLVPTTYIDKKKPTINEVSKKEILGRQIGSGYGIEVTATQKQQKGIEKIWKYVGGENNFLFGIDKIGVSHRDFFELKKQVESIGKLKIIQGLKLTGSLRYETSFDEFETIFGDIEDYMKIFRSQKYPIKIVIE